MRKPAARMKKFIAAGAAAVLSVSLAVVVTAGGGHASKPVTTAGSTWAGVDQSGLLGSIFRLL